MMRRRQFHGAQLEALSSAEKKKPPIVS